ncbi:molybdenum cofactor guanylyltransferase [Nosocomiicoccus massiliensis]|uniref:molybdenum cofactor guanylyltransferase n=1 Tax=Nosocomiicoccus massiliensis TaxID=1232430 RepID=UPI000400DFF0|nr:molybdenum cofactor guanylyltransferase [Nosocomiicoccus massiliensis]
MVIGAVLAGGNSTRFGSDKSLYALNDTPMYMHVVNRLKKSGVVDEIVVNTNARLKDAFHPYKTVIDDESFIDHGPLGGIYALMKEYPDDYVIIVSTDTPYVPSAWLKVLVEKAIETNKIVVTEGEQLHPLIGVYHGETIVEDLKRQLESNKLSIRQFLEHQDYITLNIEDYGLNESMFVNINRKTDIL